MQMHQKHIIVNDCFRRSILTFINHCFHRTIFHVSEEWIHLWKCDVSRKLCNCSIGMLQTFPLGWHHLLIKIEHTFFSFLLIYFLNLSERFLVKLISQHNIFWRAPNVEFSQPCFYGLCCLMIRACVRDLDLRVQSAL